MTVRKIIAESMEKNPLGVMEAFKEEISERLKIALEAKMKEKDEEYCDDEDDEDEDEDEDEDDK